MSKKMNVGRVAMCAKGEWSAESAYGSLDLVTHSDALWIAKCDNTAEEPQEGSEFWDKVIDTVIAAVQSGGESTETSSEPLVFLPEEIFVVNGRTIEIYNKNICPDADRYHFKWTCDIGKSYGRKFSVEGTTENKGDHPLTLEIIDGDGRSVVTLSSKICIRNMDDESIYAICSIGGGHVDGKAWISEIKNQLSSQKFEFLGTSYSGLHDVYHEGRLGWTSDVYLTQESYMNDTTGEIETNPFWESGFSWAYYMMNSGNIPSAVQIFFGDKELVSSDAATFSSNIEAMIDRINTDMDDNSMPRIPIFVVLPPLCGPQDGFAADSTGQLTGNCKYELDRKYISAAKKLYETVKAAGHTNVFFVPVMQCHDTDNNFGSQEVALNPRSTDTASVPMGAVYPTDQGYLQMADIIFSAYMQAFSA